MIKPKHTPGPWEWVGKNLETSNGSTVLEIDGDGGPEGCTAYVEATESDKSLIASAPDLFEVCEHLLKEFDYIGAMDGGNELLIKATVALKKAKGYL